MKNIRENERPLNQLRYIIQNRSAYMITWFFPKARGRLFWKIYVYFRWVDDIVDSKSLSQGSKREFLDLQNKLLKQMYEGRCKRKKMRHEEKGIYDAIMLYKGSKDEEELKKHIFNMMQTFEYDLQRHGKAVDEREFMKYSRYISDAYAFVFLSVWGIKKNDKHYNKKLMDEFGKTIYDITKDYAHHCHLIHTLRDFDEDTEFLQIKSPEKFKKFIREEVIGIIPLFRKYSNCLIKSGNFCLSMVIWYTEKRFLHSIRNKLNLKQPAINRKQS
jgi:hypothetical protein